MRIRMLIIFMISLVSLSSFAGQSFPKISKSEIKNLSYNKLQILRNSLVTFNKSFDDQIKLKHEYSYIKFLINSAYAAESNMCFFGGWPSRKVGKYCQAPWKHRGDKEINEMDLYSKNITCGSNSKFRCNPVLFGSDAKSDKGICIDTGGTYKNLTDKCEEQSRQNIDGLIEDYKNDPTKLDDYLKKVTQFCITMPEYDACDSLSKRLNSITGKGNIKKNSSLNKPSQAKAILDTCQEKALAQDNDIHGRNILEQISDLDGCKPRLATDMNSIEDFKKISDSVEKSQYLAKVNEVAFKEGVKAFIGNSFKFKVDDKIDKAISSEADLKKYLKSNAPHLFEANESGMDQALTEAFSEINNQVKAASLVRFDPDEAANTFNEYAKILNNMCSSYFNEKEAMFGKQNKIQRAWDNKKEELHYLEQNKKFSKVLDEMLQNTTAGYLISSDHFKVNVFDPSVNMAEESSYSKNYKLFNDKISKTDITKGTKDINSLLKKNLKEISNTQNSIAKGDTSEVDDHLREYLKSDPSIVRMTLSHLDNSSGSEFASYICSETLDIYDSDETWRYVDWTVAGLGVTAGVVLTATGVGSPLGIALTTTSIGLAGFEATSATLSYIDAQKREAASDRAQIEKRKELQEYMNTQMTTNGQKTEALWTGGLAML